MPSRKPRIALTVDCEIDDVLTKLSELTGDKKTKIITDFLRDLLPVFVDLEKSLRHVKETKEAMPELAKWTAIVNQHVAVMNSEMSELYRKESEK